MFRRRCIFPSRWRTFRHSLDLHAAARRFPAALFTLVFPEDCRVCGEPLTEITRTPVCRACLSAAAQPLDAEYFCSVCRTPFLNRRPLDEMGRCGLCRDEAVTFDSAYSFGEHEGALRKLVHLYKYEKMRPLAAPLGRMIASAIPEGERFDAVVPMPLHWRRRWSRGFNQSELLARAAARRAGVPVLRALKRCRATDAQAGLTNAQRRRNVAGAFRITAVDAVRGKRVLLVDDVLTTGATARSAASVLKRSGAARVAILTLARADRRRALES